MKKILIIFIVLLFVASPVLAQETEFLTFGTSDIGGVWFAEGAALATQWNAEIPEIQITTDTRGGGTGNAQWMATGKVDLAINNTPGINAAMQGSGFFKEQGKLDFSNVRSLAALHKSYLTIVVRDDSDMDYATDIKGKRIAVGQPGNSIQTIIPALTKVWGWDQEELQQEFIADYDAFDALKAGRIDAIVEWIGLGSGAYVENFEMGGLKLLPMKKENMAKLEEEYPFYVAGEIPDGSYKAQGAVPVPFAQDFLTVQADLSNEIVYKLAEVMYKHLKNGNLAATHSAFKEAEFPSHIERISLNQLHPGAKKFYEEIGVTLD